jgi:hypothetical protein
VTGLKLCGGSRWQAERAGGNCSARRGSASQASRAPGRCRSKVSPTNGGATVARCKTKGSHRTIRLDAPTVTAIETHRERQLVEREAAGEAYVDRDLIFADKLGGLIRPERLTDLSTTFGKPPGSVPGACTTFATRTRRTCSPQAYLFTSWRRGSVTRVRSSR